MAHVRQGAGFAHRVLHSGQEVSFRSSVDSLPSKMRAVVQKGYGSPEESIGFSKVPLPVISPFDVLIKVKAASFNSLDAKLRHGWGKGLLTAEQYYIDSTQSLKAKAPPFIMGRDFSGEVVRVGASVPHFPYAEVGEQVMGHVDQLRSQGSMAEYVKVPFWNLYGKPDHLTHAEASTIPFTMTGALNLMEVFGTHQDGKKTDKIAILGGATGGSVGFTTALILKSMGFDPTVFRFTKDNSHLYDAEIDFQDYSHENYQRFMPTTMIQTCATPVGLWKTSLLKKRKNDFPNYDAFKKHVMNIDEKLKDLETLVIKSVASEIDSFEHMTSSQMDGIKLLYDQPHMLTANSAILNSLLLEKPISFSATKCGFNLFCNEVVSNQMTFRTISPQTPHHLVVPAIMEQVESYLKEKTTKPNMVCLERIYPFSKAINAHKRLDEGIYSAKMVLSMKELEDEDQDEVEYTDLPHLVDSSLPSTTLYSLLRSGRTYNKE